MKKRLLLLMMMAGGAMMLPAQEPGGMLPAQEPGGMLPAQEQVEMASIDADSAAIEQTDAATAEQTDTVLPDPDPEWYVAPLNYDSVMARHNAPRRAATNNCPIDSVRTFNVDSVLESVSVYEYGDTTRTMIWTVNPDGSRYGSGREESSSTANSTYSATYAWDFTTNDWAGVSREEHYFVGSKDTAWLVYAWVNNAWVVNIKYTYVYDAAGRETEFTTYERNAAGQLAYSMQRIREYDTAGKTTLDIQYTAHNGSDWSAGTKRIYAYDGNNTILDEYYSSYTNGTWVGSAKKVWEYTAGRNTYYEQFGWSNGDWVSSYRENWTYTAGNKTYYEKNTWSNNAWVGTTKEIWAFFNDNSKKQSLHKKYGWANGDWAISQCDSSVYDAAGNNTLVENYTYTNGVQKGSKKEEYTYSGSTKIATITYKWSNNAWVYNVWTVSDKVSVPNESCRYVWTNDAWVGNGNRTLTTNNSSNKPIEVITQTWSTEVADWLNYTRKTTAYEGAKTTQEATYTWSTDANDWVGATRSDWHYNAQGKNDTIKTYTNNGTDWIYSDRTAKTYNAAGTEIMVHNAHWDAENSKWVMTSMTRTDIVKDAAGHELLYATWRCDADSVWVGVKKDTAAYSETGKQLYSARYTSWSNNAWVPSFKIVYEYDGNDYEILNERLDWVSNSWRGNYRYEYVCDQQGRRISSAIYSSWSTYYSNWVGTIKTETVYGEANQTLSTVTYSWSNNAWKESNRNLYEYDAAGNTIGQVVQNYTNNTWTNSIRFEKEYNGNNLIKDNSYEWANDTWRFTRRNEVYYDGNKLRREIQGTWNNGAVVSYFDNLYFYDSDYQLYTIRFENYDGTLLQSVQVKETKKPTYTGETPAKPATEQYTYTFKGWTPAIATVTGDATYTAEYDSVVNRYRITWLNADDVEVAVDSLEYGAMPSHEDVVKPSTSEWAYLFAGWSPAIVTVTGDATYKAQLDSIQNGYRITWLDADDTELAADSLAYGAMPSHEYVLKANTAEWTYSFVGWTPEIAAVTGDATYKAQIDSVRNRYRITWLDADDTEIAADSLEYGAMPSHEYVLKANTAEWTYSFVGWTPEIAAVTGDATYKAQIDSVRNRYRITWLDADDTEIAVDSLVYGATPSREYVLKANTAEWTYSFVGWTPEIVAVTGDATYKAQIDSVRNSYRIVWLDTDDTELAVDSLEYGATPSREYVVKANTAEWTYSFVGWMPEIAAVTGDATYKAQIDSVRNRYRITWLDADDSEIAVDSLAYGATPSREYVLKANTAEWTYSFVGWTPEIAAVTGDATYKAQIDSVRNSYLITFKNGEESLQSTQVAYGTMPVYEGEEPTKQGDAQYTYSFNGWDAEIAAVTGEATYNATFTSTVNTYTITWLMDDGTKIDEKEMAYGATPTHADAHKDNTAQYTITFVGWDKDFAAVTGDATYTAVFDSVVNTYTITFLFDNGVTILDQQVFEYGQMPSTNFVPSRESDAQYSYTFIGWSPELVPVTGDASYVAMFEAMLNQYTIIFRNYDGTELQNTKVDYGTMPEYTGETPTRKGNMQYSYDFIGWSPELDIVTGDATYTAVYEQVLTTYTIIFYDEDGVTVLDSVEVEYGKKPSTTVIPTKEDDEQYTYTFAGWSPTIVAATRNTSYTATYTATLKSEGLWDVETDEKAQKVMIDGVMYIIRGGKRYGMDGAIVE